MATRVLNGKLREVWRETVPLGGGSTQIIDTGIPLRSADLARIRGVIIPSATIGQPEITAVSTVANQMLRVTITNTAAAGHSVSGYTLDVQFVHSVDQADDTAASGEIYFLSAAEASGPLSGTLRLYVHGTNGDDTAQGSSWATAWKTYAKLEQELAAILAPNPTALTLIVYVRGDFTGQDLTLAALLHGSSRLYVVHHMDDWTEVAGGTVATVAASSFLHGLREVTFNGIVLDPVHEGCALVLEDGAGQRVVYQILRVWNNGGTLTATISQASVPGWVVAGVSASIRQPSLGCGSTLHCSVLRVDDDKSYLQNEVALLRLVFDEMVFRGGSVTCSVVQPSATSNDGILVKDGAHVVTEFSYASGDYGVPAWLAAEFGMIGSNTTDTSAVGSVSNGGTGTSVRAQNGASCGCCGVARKSVFAVGPSSLIATRFSGVYISAEGEGASCATLRAILGRTTAITLGAVYCRTAYVSVALTSFLDLHADGVGSGFFNVSRFGTLRIQSTVDGNNTGSGTGLVVANCVDGEILFDGNPSVNLKGEYGFLNQTDGRVRLAGNYVQGALEGGGPDLYVEKGTLTITGAITKSATNPSGGFVAQPVLKCRRGAKVVMDASKTFTLPDGSGNNTTDYGANGAIDIETCCDIALETLAGGNAAATNTAVRVKRASRLAHAGAAPTWGAQALDLGGAAALQAMPATPTSDSAAATPEDCRVLPGSA